MDTPPPDLSAAPAARTSFMTVVACLGLLAMAAGWFLPWIARVDVNGIGVRKADLERLDESAKKDGVPDDVVAVIKRMLANEAVSGSDLSTLGRYWIGKEEGLDAKERRGWALGLAVLRYAPWAAVAAAALLALGALRKPNFLTLTFVLSIAILIGGFAGLMWIGASEQAKDSIAHDPKVLGVGIYAIALGGLAAFVGGVFAVRRCTWWKAYLLTIAVVVAAVVGAVAYVDPK